MVFRGLRVTPSHLAIGLLLVSVVGCTQPDDKTLIERVIRSAVKATQDKKPSGVVARVADDFKGPRGVDRAEVQRMLMGRLLRKQWLRVFERDLQVTVEDERAQAVLRVVVARGDQVQTLEDLVPTDASALRFDLQLAKREGSWWIVEAGYKEEPLTLDAL